MNSLEKAKKMLDNQEFTCVLCNSEKTYTSKLRGVAPMLEYIETGVDLKGFSAADKVVGKAAAMLFAAAGVKEIYANVLSQSALRVLEENNVEVFYGVLTEHIINRKKDGICPMEQAVKDIEEPMEGLEIIKKKVQEMKQGNS